MFSDATIQHLMVEVLDYVPILLEMDGRKTIGKRPFKFLEAWTSDKRSCEVVDVAWNQQIRGGMEAQKI